MLTGGVGNVIGTLFGVLINGTIVSILQFNGTLSSWWTRIGVGALTLIFIGIQSLFYMKKKLAPENILLALMVSFNEDFILKLIRFTLISLSIF